MSKTDNILAEMDTIANSADLTEDQMTRYEELEVELRSVRKAEEIQKRNAAYKTPSTTPVVTTSTKPDETLERAFADYLRTGKENSDLTELRAQSTSGSAGGYMIPDGFRQKLTDRMKAFGGVANVVETITTESGNSLEWPTVDTTSQVGEIVAEGGTFASGADITFGTKSLGAYRYMAGGASNLPLRVSVELLQDSAFDVEALVSRKLGGRIARIQAQHIVRGDGSGEPLGLIHGLTGLELPSGGVSYDFLVDAIHSVDPAYRDGAVWTFNDASLATVKKIKDSHGDPIWRPADADLGTGTGGGTLLGYPVVVDQAFQDILLTAGAAQNWGAFGDLREGYVVRRVRDLTIVVNPYNRAAYGEVEFTAWARMDATQQNVNAYKALAGYTA